MVDFIVVSISSIIFVFYLLIIFMSLWIRKRLRDDAGTAFIYVIIAILFLVIKRLQQIFFEAELVTSIPYFTDLVTLVFAILFFMAILSFYRGMKRAGSSRQDVGQSFSDYRKKLRRI